VTVRPKLVLPWGNLLIVRGWPPVRIFGFIVGVLLDMLRYNRSQPAAYPTGRTLTDDVYSARFASAGTCRWPGE
jgi:hypothetical protein